MFFPIKSQDKCEINFSHRNIFHSFVSICQISLALKNLIEKSIYDKIQSTNKFKSGVK